MIVTDIIDKLSNNGFSYGSLEYLCIAGSKLHGNSVSNSDVDIRGIFTPNEKDMLLGQGKNTYSYTYYEGEIKYDVVLFSIHHFLNKLIGMECNAVEILFSFNSNCNLFYTEHFKSLMNDSKKLLHKNVSSFVGLANSVIKGYKKNHNDYKNLSHGLRIIYQAKEFLDTGELKYPIKQAEYLKFVKEGNIDSLRVYDDLLSQISEIHYIKEESLPTQLELKDKLILKMYGIIV